MWNDPKRRNKLLAKQIVNLPEELQEEATEYINNKEPAKKACKKAYAKMYNERKRDLAAAFRHEYPNTTPTEEEALEFFINQPFDDLTPERAACLLLQYHNDRKTALERKTKNKAENNAQHQREQKLATERERKRAREATRVREKIKNGEELTSEDEMGLKRIKSSKASFERVREFTEEEKAAKVKELAVQRGIEEDDYEALEELEEEVMRVLTRPAGKMYSGLYKLNPEKVKRRREYYKAYDAMPKRKAQKKLWRAMNPTTPEQRAVYRNNARKKLEALSLEEQRAHAAERADYAKEWRKKKVADNKKKSIKTRLRSIWDMIKEKQSIKDPLEKKELFFESAQASFDAVVIEFITSMCFYCGTKEDLGIDRLDSAIGYLKGNVVPCCHACNMSKRTLTTEEFKAICADVHNYDHDPTNDGKLCLQCGEADPTSKDQRVPGAGYHPENVDMLCVPCNYLKRLLSVEELHLMCKNVTEKDVDPSTGPDVAQACIDRAEAKQVEEKHGKLVKKRKTTSTKYYIGREAGDTVVYRSVKSGTYHTPAHLTAHLCLREGGIIKQKLIKHDAVDLLKKSGGGSRIHPCKVCRRAVSPEEFEVLDNLEGRVLSHLGQKKQK